MIVGDLVKYNQYQGYNKHGKENDDKGVWLVIAVEIDETFGELITLKKGNEQRLAHPSHLDKISSSR
tara:strand:+ start:118 stop:318 length:201 start_codon:yes stop_codon:yes gene_type:complete